MGSKELVNEMNRYYEARAPWHDQYMHYSTNEVMEARLSRIVDVVADIATGERVLEIACGTGNWTGVLAKRAATVVALDISPSALAIAREKLSSHSNVTLLQADAYDLRSVIGSFDVLFAADWWSHVPKSLLPRFLSGAMGKLGREPVAVFLDMLMSPHFEREPCLYDGEGNRISARSLPDGSVFEVVKNFPDGSELRRTLATYGTSVACFEYPDLGRWMAILRRP